ncbi:Phenylacetate-coenzyme A ligase PaaK, adenylate-forming domain family [Lentzea waywayandensis]|uniref:long-chain-fatty-acyl-CoA reductase n=1 Tax=Lentzea waywayandensis TaxID=84724 RepID=A0A1I6E127_9PSEU|nr:acyl-CoA reductase [Lentzea waywayandensis]SFR11327.1 Phenylacetate-coenzyme A ligase PaaK, adenylate-forming domain family [Lentzea waywayandensis]
MNRHLWQGEWIDDDAVALRLDTLDDLTQQVITGPRLNPLVVLAAAEKLDLEQHRASLVSWGLDEVEIDETLEALRHALSRVSLERKLKRELGNLDPARMVRFDFRAPVYEAWVPLGLLAHVTAGNAPVAGVLSAVEGLLSGNLNVIKVASDDSGFTAEVLASLAAHDQTGQIAARLVVLHFSSSLTDWMSRMLGAADAVAVWGGEEAITGVTELVRPGTRVIDWGPKLSFAYLTGDSWSDVDTLHALAADVCQLEQQACSSPQVIYLDTEDPAEVFAFAERFASVLELTGPPTREPSQAEWAEITNTVVVTQLEEHLRLTKVHTGDHWRVLADVRSALRTSPLYRTVWVKPLPRKQITSVLRPMRRYLQTVGLAADRPDTAALARSFVSVGVQRITTPGSMLGGYSGEPHDGVYALQRYSNRVSVQLDDRFAADASLDDLAESRQLPVPSVPVTLKSDFETLQDRPADVYFRSGGSSGAPKLSAYTWADWDEQMWVGAEALLATGLDPRHDRIMNLFFNGHMYASFVSFFSALERMNAVQFPMGGEWGQLDAIAQAIVDNRVDTLLTAPSFVQRLFAEHGDQLKQYGGIRKIFYAGEHFGAQAIARLRDEFGVEVIRSAAYATVDAGPVGYQCQASSGKVHHLFTGLHTLEILDPETDQPVSFGEPGRLVFTTHTRRGQRLERYEIGDLGRWVPGDCPCGRQTPRFELLGRTGDVFRAAAQTLNYRRFLTILEDEYSYAGALQIELNEDAGGEELVVRMERDRAPEPAATHITLLSKYGEVAEAVEQDSLLTVRVENVPLAGFLRTKSSGKLIAVVDQRSSRSV